MNVRVLCIPGEGKHKGKVVGRALWTYTIPAMTPGGGRVISVDRFKAWVGDSYETVVTVDSLDSIAEVNEDNNEARSRLTIGCDNPLADAFKTVKEKAKQGKGWCIKKGKYVWRKVEYATPRALARVAAPFMVAWVKSSKKIHEGSARKLTASERLVLKDYFPDGLLEKTRVKHIERWKRPEFWTDFRGIAFENVVVINKNYEITHALLAHEITHGYQYAQLGLYRFCYLYLLSTLKNGYDDNAMEIQAKTLEAHCRDHLPIPVGEVLGY